MEIIKVNTSDYYDNHYLVTLYSGAGIWTQSFDVYANYEMQAVEIVVAYCDNNNLHGFLIEIDCDNFDMDMSDDSIIYIDATIEGASKPYFIYSNLSIEEI